MSELKSEEAYIRIVLVDDQSIIRDGLKMILELEPDLKVVGMATNGMEATQLAQTLHPDVMLMDIRMPVMDGVAATVQICEHHKDIKIIILTTFSDDAYIFDALVAGAKGYLLKDVQSDELANAIRTVVKGGVLIHPDIAEKMVKVFSHPRQVVQSDAVEEPTLKSKSPSTEETKLPEISKLTQRENEIAGLIRKGKSNKEIASELFLSEGTVKNHITNILSKLELRDRTQIALYREQ